MTCIYSVDNPFSNVAACETADATSVERGKASFNPSAGLRCGGYGSAMVVTTTFAMVAVAEVLKKLRR